MRWQRGWIVAGACVLALGEWAMGQGVDETTCVDFRALGTFASSEVVESGIRVTATEDHGFPGTVQVTAANGLGVVGGAANNTVDFGEGLRFEFDGFLASHAWFQITGSINSDGDGLIHEVSLTAYGPEGKLGSVLLDGPEMVYVPGLFGGSPLSSFRLDATDDRLRLGVVCYVRAPSETCIDFSKLGTFQVSEFTVGGMRISATEDFGLPGVVKVTAANGLGVVGSDTDTTVDTSEGLRIEFLDSVPSDVWYRIGLAYNGDGDGFAGEAVLRAYGPGGWRLGDVSVADSGIVYVNGLYAGSPVSGFRLRPVDGDRLVVREVCSISRERGCATDLDGDGDTDVLDFGVFVLDFGCGTD